MYDAIIVGGGPAGLSAALGLGRCRRKVLVFDDERPRNGTERGVRGFLTREGVMPSALRAIGREELAPYGVKLRVESIVDAQLSSKAFVVETSSGQFHASRKLLIATGVRDRLPTLLGIEPLLGSSVFQCPYCDGWEVRDQRLAVLAASDCAAEAALGLLTWSSNVVLFTNGAVCRPEDLIVLEENGVTVATERVLGLRGQGGRLLGVELEGLREVERDALFLHLGQSQRSPLLARLGCPATDDGTIEVRDGQSTAVAGLYVAGDAARGAQSVAMAVAEGATAAKSINEALRRESMRLGPYPQRYHDQGSALGDANVTRTADQSPTPSE